MYVHSRWWSRIDRIMREANELTYTGLRACFNDLSRCRTNDSLLISIYPVMFRNSVSSIFRILSTATNMSFSFDVSSTIEFQTSTVCTSFLSLHRIVVLHERNTSRWRASVFRIGAYAFARSSGCDISSQIIGLVSCDVQVAYFDIIERQLL